MRYFIVLHPKKRNRLEHQVQTAVYDGTELHFFIAPSGGVFWSSKEQAGFIYTGEAYFLMQKVEFDVTL